MSLTALYVGRAALNGIIVRAGQGKLAPAMAISGQNSAIRYFRYIVLKNKYCLPGQCSGQPTYFVGVRCKQERKTERGNEKKLISK